MRHDLQVPHGARPGQNHEIPGHDVVDAFSDGFDDPGRLVAEQEREVVCDRALPVVEVSVTDPAGLHANDCFLGTGIGDPDGFQ